MIQKVIFEVKAYSKFRQYISKANTEISGLGIVEKNKEEGLLIIKDLWLLPQKCTSATTDIDKEGLAKMYDQMIDEGKDTSIIKLWWHSHCDMPVFWSNIDADTINDFDTEELEENWFLSIVGNKEAKLKCRLDIFEPIRVSLDNLPWEINFSNEIFDQEVETDMNSNYEEIIDPISEIPESIDDFWFKKNGIPIPTREII